MDMGCFEGQLRLCTARAAARRCRRTHQAEEAHEQAWVAQGCHAARLSAAAKEVPEKRVLDSEAD